MTAAFKVGDRVTRMVHRQRSHGGGQRVEEGEVVAVVPAGIHVEIACDDARVTKPDGSNGYRDHESYIVRAGSKNFWPRVAVLRAVVEEPTEIPPYAGRKHDGQFTSFENWCDKAKSWIGGLDAACFDAKGRPCRAGLDFMRARDEGAFPVRYWFPRESAHWQQTRDLEDAAARTP